jgi:cell division septation protein DedD
MSNIDSGFPSNSGAGSPSKHEVQAEDILEISDAIALPAGPATAEIDDVILFPGPEPVVVPVEHETLATRIDDSQETEAKPVMGTGDQSFVKPARDYRSAAQGVPAMDKTLSVKELLLNEPEEPKRVRLISFSASKLLVVAGAFLLFIILAEVLTRTSVKVNGKAENGPATAPLSSPQAAPNPTPAPVQAPAAGISAQTPAVMENKSVEKKVAADPSPAQASTADQPAPRPDDKDKGMFTIQVGSHKDPGAANAQAEKLKAAGFEPRVVSAEIPNRGTWYRVQVGKFGSRDEANRVGAQIVSKGAAENFVLSGL